jgi:hypothetical protein
MKKIKIGPDLCNWKNPIPETKGSLKNKRTDQHWLKPATLQTRNGYMTKKFCSLFIKGRAKKVAPKSMKTKSHNQAPSEC